MSSIICGNCGQTHASVQNVKSCYDIGALNKAFGGRADTTPRFTAESEGDEFLFGRAPKSNEPKPDTAPWTPDDAGIYKNHGTIYKVYKALSGNHMLCKELIADKESKSAVFEYRGGPRRFVRHDQLLTLEEAKEFGTIYGVCAMCGRTLTDETSIANGIGPICASKVSF